MEYCVNIVPAWLNLLKMNVMKSLELPLMQKISKFSNFIRIGIECQLSRDRAGRNLLALQAKRHMELYHQVLEK